MSQDVENIFEDSLLSLFDHYPVAVSTSGPHEPYLYTPSLVPFPDGLAAPKLGATGQSDATKVEPLKIYLPIAPSSLHTTLQLTHLWLSSLYMADLISSSHPSLPLHGQRVCELGAGAGLPGIVALVNGGAVEVVGTDYAVPEQEAEGEEGDGQADAEDVLGVLRGNYRKAVEARGGELKRKWAVTGHTWGETVEPLLAQPISSPSSLNPSTSEANLHSRKFTTLLLADLLWSSSAHSSLITSVLSLLHPTLGVAHVISGLHQGRGPVERFKALWRETGAEAWVKEIDEVRWGRDGWERYDPRGGEGREWGSENERGVIVWFVIGRGEEARREYERRIIPL